MFPQQQINEKQYRHCWKQGVSTWSVLKSYKKGNWGDQVSSVGESVKKGLSLEAEE
jgi:hypothetical protein